MGHAPLFAPAVVVPLHVRALAREDPDVVRVVVRGIAVGMMHHLVVLELATELPGGDRAVLVVALAGPAVPALDVAPGCFSLDARSHSARPVNPYGIGVL